MKNYLIEQINVSDDMYVISEIYSESSDGKISKGDIIFSYESSKSDYEVIADSDGWIQLNPQITVGKEYPVGTIVAVFDEKGNIDPNIFQKQEQARTNSSDEFIITKKAEALIKEVGIELSEFEGHDIITEDLVRSKLITKKFTKEFQDIKFYQKTNNQNYFTLKRKKRLAVVGAGKAALQVLDAVESSNEHNVVVFYDNNTMDNLVGIPVINYDNPEKIYQDFKEGVFEELIISFSGNINARKSLFETLQSLGIPFTNIIHKSAWISTNVKIGLGNLIFANTRIGPFSEIENNNVLSAYTNIEHHNYIGSHNTYGPGVLYSGSCSTGNSNRFGSGIYIEPNVKVGNNCVIASGVVLTFKVPDKHIVQNKNKYELKELTNSDEN